MKAIVANVKAPNDIRASTILQYTTTNFILEAKLRCYDISYRALSHVTATDGQSIKFFDVATDSRDTRFHARLFSSIALAMACKRVRRLSPTMMAATMPLPTIIPGRRLEVVLIFCVFSILKVISSSLPAGVPGRVSTTGGMTFGTLGRVSSSSIGQSRPYQHRTP